MPKLSDDYGSEKTIKLVEDLCSLFYTSNDAMTAAQNNSTNFASGEYILYSNYAHNAANAFKDVTFDMSVLPFPKYDEAQKDYITTESFSYSIYMIPMDAKNTDKSGAVMEARPPPPYLRRRSSSDTHSTTRPRRCMTLSRATSASISAECSARTLTTRLTLRSAMR